MSAAENEILVSVIIPVYNTEQYLEKCINSVLAQSLVSFEVILVDDGSQDNGPRICQEYSQKHNKIRFFSQEHRGANAARKYGLIHARGIYICFVDSDDWIEETMLEHLAQASMNGEIDLVSSGLLLHKEFGTSEWKDRLAPGCYMGKDLETLYEQMLYKGKFYQFGIIPNLCGKLIKKTILDQAFVHLDERITYGEDAAVVYPSCLFAERIVSMQEVFYHYVVHKESSSFQIDYHQFENTYRLYQHLHKCFSSSQMKDSLEKQLKYYITMLEFRVFKNIYDVDLDYREEYFFPWEQVKGKKILLYGAGKVGESFFRQIKKKGYEIVGWTDSDWKTHQRKWAQIMPPQEIGKLEYDLIVIAVASNTVAKQIGQQLLKAGIDRGKIVWHETYRPSVVEKIIG